MTLATTKIPQLTKLHLWSALAVGVFLLALLLPRTAITPQDNDSAELATAAVLQSLLHPPGFPLYSSLADLLVAFFPSNPFLTLAVFSACAQAGAAALLVVLGGRLGVSPLLATGTAIAWGCYEPTLRLGTATEVFALANLLIVLLLLTAVWFYQRPQCTLWSAGILGIVCGLAACHHTMVIFWFPLVVLLLGSKAFSTRRWTGVGDALFAAAAGALLGLAPYLLLLGRYAHAPQLAFAPLRNGLELIGYILRIGYGSFSLHAATAATAHSYLPNFLELTWSQLPLLLVAPLLLLVKLGHNFQKTPHRSLVIGTLFTIAGLSWFTTQLKLPAQPDFSIFLMRFYSTITLALAQAVLLVLQPIKRPVLVALLFLALTLPGLYYLPATLSQADTRADRRVAEEIQQILTALPPDAIFVTDSDRIAFALGYEQRVRQQRPDITVIITGMLLSNFYREALTRRLPILKGHNTSYQEIIDTLIASGAWVGALAETRPPADLKLGTKKTPDRNPIRRWRHLKKNSLTGR